MDDLYQYVIGYYDTEKQAIEEAKKKSSGYIRIKKRFKQRYSISDKVILGSREAFQDIREAQ